MCMAGMFSLPSLPPPLLPYHHPRCHPHPHPPPSHLSGSPASPTAASPLSHSLPPTHPLTPHPSQGHLKVLQQRALSLTPLTAPSPTPSLTPTHSPIHPHPSPPRVTCKSYSSVPDVIASDHKPVYATLSLTMPHVDLRRQSAAFAAISRPLWHPCQAPPELTVAPESVVLAAAAEGRALQIRRGFGGWGGRGGEEW